MKAAAQQNSPRAPVVRLFLFAFEWSRTAGIHFTTSWPEQTKKNICRVIWKRLQLSHSLIRLTYLCAEYKSALTAENCTHANTRWQTETPRVWIRTKEGILGEMLSIQTEAYAFTCQSPTWRFSSRYLMVNACLCTCAPTILKNTAS